MTDAPTGQIYLDADIFIESLDGTPEKADRLRSFFLAFNARPGRAVTSEFVLAEVMGKESPTLGWALQSRFFLDLIVWGRVVDLMPVSRDILLATGDLRRTVMQSGRSLKLADAIHVATAVKARCAYVLSSDRRLIVPAPLKRLDPHAIDRSAIEKLLDA